MSDQTEARPPLHPYLAAAFPVVSLAARNPNEISLRDALLPLGEVLAAAALLQFLLGRLIRSRVRAGLLTTLIVSLFMNYGVLYRAVAGRRIGDRLIGADLLTFPVVVIVGVGLSLVALRARSVLRASTTITVVALVLVAGQLAAIAAAKVQTGGASDASIAAPAATGEGTGGPDIFYIIPDRFAGPESLERAFSYDLSPFVRLLESQGFQVAEQSRSNYPITAHSLASSMNMTYLDELASAMPDQSDDIRPLWDAIGRSAVARFLQQRGYTYVHIGSWYEGTSDSPLADEVINADTRSEFSQVLWDSTLLRPVARVTGLGEDRWDSRRSHWRRVRLQFDALRRANRPGPTFVFAHILSPHYPFAFTPDGGYVSLEQERRVSFAENYRRQVRYAEAQLASVVRDLLAVPEAERPVIVIQADEGVHPLRAELDPEFPWRKATDAELRDKFPILNAVRLPATKNDPIPEGGSPVNQFRILFNSLFDAELPLLPDRSFIFEDHQHLYSFEDVTARTRPSR